MLNYRIGRDTTQAGDGHAIQSSCLRSGMQGFAQKHANQKSQRLGLLMHGLYARPATASRSTPELRGANHLTIGLHAPMHGGAAINWRRRGRLAIGLPSPARRGRIQASAPIDIRWRDEQGSIGVPFSEVFYRGTLFDMQNVWNCGYNIRAPRSLSAPRACLQCVQSKVVRL